MTHITLHLPYHRERALLLQGEPGAGPAYDAHIANYLRFLQAEAAKAGYHLDSDQSSIASVYSIAASSREAKAAAHHWLELQPDIWNWMP